MRTPLTSIKGYSTALLMEDADFSPETQREFLHIIDEECDILQDLIHDLLESSMIDAGFLKLELEPVTLSHLIKGVVDDIARRSPDHRFVVDLPARLPDPGRRPTSHHPGAAQPARQRGQVLAGRRAGGGARPKCAQTWSSSVWPTRA